MTDRDALLMAIVMQPYEDLPRLMYADWLEENSDSERAAFIRVQCELARCERCGGDGLAHGSDRPFEWNDHADYGKCVVCWAIRGQAGKLLNSNFCSWVPLSWHQGSGVGIRRASDFACEFTGSFIRTASFTCGLISHVTCSWADWLAHAPKLVWWPPRKCEKCKGSGRHRTPTERRQNKTLTCSACHGKGEIPGATMECPNCRGNGRHLYGEFPSGELNYSDSIDCHMCVRGRIPVPFESVAATVQPITEVTLTTWPNDVPPGLLVSGTSAEYVRWLSEQWPPVEKWHLPTQGNPLRITREMVVVSGGHIAAGQAVYLGADGRAHPVR